MPDTDYSKLIDRLDRFLDITEKLLSPLSDQTDWSANSYLWQKHPLSTFGSGYLRPLNALPSLSLAALKHIERQKQQITQNTLQFLDHRPANHVLLTGAKGTGKSSLIKALLTDYCHLGLRLIEVRKKDLADLAHIVDKIAHRPERFIIFCDDLSFESHDTDYKALKVALDGSLSGLCDNLLIYATSNRKHLVPEYFVDNLATTHLGEEIHPGDSVEEKISLSERFGLCLSFYPFDQDEYWSIATHWLSHFGLSKQQIEDSREEALRWTLERGSRSGRVAWQFAKHYAGQIKTL